MSPAIFAALLLVRRRMDRAEGAALLLLYTAFLAIAIGFSS